MASVVVSFAVQAVTYLKPLGAEEVRATEDGRSWATAYSTVQAAVDAIADEGCVDKTIYAAQGVYIFSTKIENLPSDFKIYGGFAGKSDTETLADRNVDAYQTIFTGDATLNDTWQRRVPTFGQHAVVTSDTSLKIIVDGKVNLPPAFAEGEDFVSYAIVFRNNTVSTAFSVAGSSYGDFDGLYFIGFGSSSIMYNSGSPAGQSAIRNCRLYGVSDARSVVASDRTTAFEISDSEIGYAYSWWRYSGLYVNGPATVSRCRFTNCSRVGAEGGSQVIRQNSTSRLTVADCTFERCIDICNCSPTVGIGGCGSIVSCNDLVLSDCVVSNCFSSIKNSAMAIVLVGGTTVCCLRSQFINNRCEQVENVDRDMEYVMFGKNRSYGVFSADNRWSECLFRGNLLKAYSPVAADGTYAMAIAGGTRLHSTSTSAVGGAAVSFVDCVFDDNKVETEEIEGVTAVRCRGVLTTAVQANDRNSSLAMTNCTFTGSAANGAYEVVQFGSMLTKPSTVVNSLFMGEDEFVKPFLFNAPELVTIENTTVKNMFTPPEVASVTGFGYDEVPLDDKFRPTVRTPDLAVVTPAEGVLYRGASQTLAVPEGAKSLVLRRDPYEAGDLGGGASSLNVTADGVTIRAVPVEGSSFTGWYKTDGSLFSDQAELTLTTAEVTSDLVLVAKFSTAGVTLTFDLGAGGTFESTGTATCSIEAAPHTAFPTPPSDIVGNDQWLVIGWLDLPATVPTVATTYHAKVITKSLRIIRYDSHVNGGARDGTSWANAYDDLAAALADAQLWKGEVHVKAGVHLAVREKVDTLVLKNGTAIRGGYLGDDDDDQARDVAGHPSVLSGDIKGDDVWNDETMSYANTSEDVTRLFDLSAATADESTVFDGLTLSGFYDSIYCGANATPFITNCTFTGYNYLYMGGDYAHVVDTTFDKVGVSRPLNGSPAALYVVGTAKGTSVIERCSFERTRTPQRGVLALQGNSHPARILSCTFRGNRQNQVGNSAGSMVAISSDNAVLLVSNCLFEANHSYGGGNITTCGNTRSVHINNLYRANTNEVYNGSGLMTGSNAGGVMALGTQYLRVEGCAFVDNVSICAAPAGTTCRANVLQLGGYPDGVVLNCTFKGNHVAATSNGGNAYAATLVAWNSRADVNFFGTVANCTFLDNDGADGDYAEFSRTLTNKKTVFVNDVFWNASSAYAPVGKCVDCGTGTGAVFVDCIAKNFDATKAGILSADRVSTEDPGLDATKALVDGNSYVIPVASTTVTRHGCPIWVGDVTATYGQQYYCNVGTAETPTYWRLRDGAVVAKPTLNGLIGDARGVERTERRFVLGASQTTKPSGLMLILR